MNESKAKEKGRKIEEGGEVVMRSEPYIYIYIYIMFIQRFRADRAVVVWLERNILFFFLVGLSTLTRYRASDGVPLICILCSFIDQNQNPAGTGEKESIMRTTTTTTTNRFERHARCTQRTSFLLVAVRLLMPPHPLVTSVSSFFPLFFYYHL
eukprot:gene7879-5505_t